MAPDSQVESEQDSQLEPVEQSPSNRSNGASSDDSSGSQGDGTEPSTEKYAALRDKVLKSSNDTGTVAEALGRRNFLLALFWIALIALAFTFEQIKTRWEYLTIEQKNKRTKDLDTRQQQEVVSPSGLRYADIKIGAGPIPRTGDLLLVEYTIQRPDGTKLISSRDRGQKALGFQLGREPKLSELIPLGLIEGLSTMHKGGKRRLIIPPELGFGDQPVYFQRVRVQPNSTLIYEIELVKVSMAPS